jgi:lipoprotein-anchoring transpeptidase ErfK/SrfK
MKAASAGIRLILGLVGIAGSAITATGQAEFKGSERRGSRVSVPTALAGRASLQTGAADTTVRMAGMSHVATLEDSVASVRARELAERASGLRLVVSLQDRLLWLIDGADTLHTAPVGVGKGGSLRYAEETWKFATPRGHRTVLDRAPSPIWVPPLWHYVELAHERGFKLVELQPGRAITLRDGSRLIVRGETVELRQPDGGFEVLPPGEEIVFDGTLYVPPFGTANRRIPGELGRYKLDLGDGYLIHGTPDQGSVGSAATHGCLRLREADLRFVYKRVPVGTPVYIY